MTRHVAVIGSREYPNLDQVCSFVRTLPIDYVMVSGGARGVDLTAENECKILGIKTKIFLPEYDKYPGKVAPLMRNTLIVNLADELFVFPVGSARGTMDSIKKALKKGIPVRVFGPDDIAVYEELVLDVLVP